MIFTGTEAVTVYQEAAESRVYRAAPIPFKSISRLHILESLSCQWPRLGGFGLSESPGTSKQPLAVKLSDRSTLSHRHGVTVTP